MFADLQNETKEKLIAISLDIKLKTISFEVVAIGSKEIDFRRDDSLLELFKGHTLETGSWSSIPCGTHCENCPSYKNPCRGCPAYYRYDF